MSRPRKSDSERIEDAFYGMTFPEQEETLRLLSTLHRLKGRNLESAVAKSMERTNGQQPRAEAAVILGDPE